MPQWHLLSNHKNICTQIWWEPPPHPSHHTPPNHPLANIFTYLVIARSIIGHIFAIHHLFNTAIQWTPLPQQKGKREKVKHSHNHMKQYRHWNTNMKIPTHQTWAITRVDSTCTGSGQYQEIYSSWNCHLTCAGHWKPVDPAQNTIISIKRLLILVMDPKANLPTSECDKEGTNLHTTLEFFPTHCKR